MTTNNWNLDTVHSGINFTVRHMVVSKVRGRFAKFNGTRRARRERPHALERGSDDRRLEHRHRHRPARRSPAVRRTSSTSSTSPRSGSSARGSRRSRGDRYRLTGELTIHGVTRSIALDDGVRRPRQGPVGQRAGRLHGERRPSTGRTSASCGTRRSRPAACSSSDRVDLELEVQAVRAAATKAA